MAEALGKLEASCHHLAQRDGGQGRGAVVDTTQRSGSQGLVVGSEPAQYKAHLCVFLFGLGAGTQTS